MPRTDCQLRHRRPIFDPPHCLCQLARNARKSCHSHQCTSCASVLKGLAPEISTLLLPIRIQIFPRGTRYFQSAERGRFDLGVVFKKSHLVVSQKYWNLQYFERGTSRISSRASVGLVVSSAFAALRYLASKLGENLAQRAVTRIVFVWWLGLSSTRSSEMNGNELPPDPMKKAELSSDLQ